jgi:CHAD domain-containing protein
MGIIRGCWAPSMDHRAALLVLLRQRLETLIDAMPAVQSGDTKSVHQARVATRRLRAALPVLRKSLDADAIDRARQRVRRMTRALGPVRELDVSLDTLGEFAGRGIASGRATTRVREALISERLSRRREMVAAITPGKVERLRRELAHVGSGPEVGGRPGAIRDAVRRVERRAKQLADAIDAAGSLYSAERLHAVRIAAKKLRYAMEIERELKRSRLTAKIRQLKSMQDQLGRLHDLQVLADHARAVQTHVAASDRRLASDIEDLISAVEEDCRKEHAAYMRRRESILKLCANPALGEARRAAVA